MFRKLLNIIPMASLAESFVDNVLRDKVREPDIGGVVYCDLAFGAMEHSGVYIGDNKIIHLNGKGWIEVVSPSEFIKGTTAISIYTSCYNSMPMGDSWFAERATKFEKEVGTKGYNFVLDNCHIFTSACITGQLDNSDSFLWMLKHTLKQNLNFNCWRVWDC